MEDWLTEHPGFSQYPLSQQIHVVCDAFDVAWSTGLRPQIEDYLRDVDATNRSRILQELLLVELEYRHKLGEAPDASEYAKRFPDDAKTIDQAFETAADQDTPTERPSITQTLDTGTGSNDAAGLDRTFDSSDVLQSTKMQDVSSQLGEFGDGRYRLVRVLGEGAFGRVYLATDKELRRQVAIKVPTADRFQKPEDADVYLAEARTVASLDHAHIVPVYDVGRTENGSIYVVSKFIEGSDLGDLIRDDRPDAETSVKLMAAVASALDHAHQRRLIHRDIKPGNILIETPEGTPYVADFGLAIKEEDYQSDGRIAGTPAYMSPEQARGEGHRLDGRSDIFSLGVVLYELLTGKRPFRGSTANELMHQVVSVDPRPLRELDDSIPAELERICLKALSKRASDRYATAVDVADDLLHWNQSPQQEAGEQQIVPKGLRSFDAEDADFYLDLLPGPRTRNGLPESIQFWKTRIEETDPDKTFSVGLIYGPSGCGKSSLVKAGLLPRLSSEVTAIYIEATPDETETRILRGLRKSLPELPDDLGLVETFTLLRRDEGNKVVIIIDQFEQWLHAHRAEQETDLVAAMRQCDGGNLQAIVMLRDDFSMAATRFMRELETRILEGHNFATVDLFDVAHAQKVLVKFGQAFANLPALSGKLSDEEQSFVESVASGLAQDGKVVSVRLALFAEMVKGKRWVPATLEKVGGTKGIGVNFLEETFSSREANPAHSLHQQAAREVLKTLLPEVGSDIKGHMRSHGELLEASGYQNRPGEFNELMRILDGELRLITPTDPEGFQTESGDDPGSKFYQLTHDYLVPSLREWLTRKQQETQRGRAELRLEERAGLWNAKPENRHLPSWWETIRIRTLTDTRKWNEPQRKMMGKATQLHGLRVLALLLLLVGIGYGGVSIRSSMVAGNQSTRAREVVESLPRAKITQVPNFVSDLVGLREWADPMLKTRIESVADGSPEKLHLSLALLPVDSDQIKYLAEQLPVCAFDQFPVVRDELASHKDEVTEDLWELVQNEEINSAQRFQAAASLATFSPEDERWTEIGPFVTKYLTGSVSSVTLGDWLDHFQPASQQLTDALATIQSDRSRPARHRETVALALAQYWPDRPDKLVDAILIADEREEFAPLVNAMNPHAAEVQQPLLDEMKAELPSRLDKTNEQLSDDDEQLRDAHWKRQALAAVALVQLGFSDDVWSLLEFSPNPSRRSFLVHFLGKLGTNHNTLAARLSLEEDVSIRRALIQSLGGLDARQVPSSDRQRITDQLKNLYVNDPDSGIHSSASWTLRQWAETLPELPVGEPTLSDEQEQRIALLAEKVEDCKQQIATAEATLPLRQVKWERSFREQATSESESLQDGLVSHYPLDESKGTVAPNAVEGQPTGVYTGPPQPEWVPGVVGNALRLDGNGGHLSCGEAFAPDRTDMFSYGCWFLADSESSRSTLFSKFANADEKGFGVRIQRGEIHCEWQHHWPDNSLEVTAKFPEVAGHWHHLFVVYDGSSQAAGVTVYLDGLAIPLRTLKDNLSESIQVLGPFQIGKRDTWFPFTGAIDDVRIYNRQLSGDEVQRLYETGLRALAGVPSETRTPEQRALLSAVYRPLDEPLLRLEVQLADLETALRKAPWKEIRRWYINGQGQTMIVIPNPATNSDSEINHSFAISSHEVTVAEFRRFQKELSVNSTVSPDNDCPVGRRDWYEVAAYCNWLSEQEGIPEDQWVYTPNTSGIYAAGMTIKENQITLSGYRLPSEAEWELACRAGTLAAYSFGEPVSLLQDFAWYGRSSSGQLHAVETLLPNDWGFFDMHGSVYEWAQNPLNGPTSPVLANTYRVQRGGSYYHPELNVRCVSRGTFVPTHQYLNSGFRLARTYYSSPELQ